MHHEASRLALERTDNASIVVASHSLAECYNQLTRGGSKSYAFHPIDAARAMSDRAARVSVRSLSSDQLVRSLSQFAGLGGRGPRLYDFLIGQVAALNAIPMIVTWNTPHFTPLFPQLRIVTPTELLETL